MNIPDKILVKIDEMQAPYAVITQVESAVLSYMRFGRLPVGIGSMAAGLFEQLRPEIDAIIRRRRKAAEYRQRRKLALQTQVNAQKPAPVQTKSDRPKANYPKENKPETNLSTFGMEGLTREEIRSIERTQRQIAQRERRTVSQSKRKKKVKTVRHYAGI